MKKLIPALCTSLILTCSVTAFANHASTHETKATTATGLMSNNNNAADQAIGDDLAWLITVNKNEIASGKLAAKKSTNADVKKFAKIMIAAHTKNLNQTKKLSHKLKAKLMETSDVTNLKKDGEKELADLKSAKSEDFDKQYVDAMAKDHSDALDKLNSLIDDAKNKNLQAHLNATREEVKKHLQMAQDLQKKLSK